MELEKTAGLLVWFHGGQYPEILKRLRLKMMISSKFCDGVSRFRSWRYAITTESLKASEFLDWFFFS